MKIGGGLILPSGSFGSLFPSVRAALPKHLPYPIEIPNGTLVRVLPIAGPMWSGAVCVVLRKVSIESTTNPYPLYQVSTGEMMTSLPKYAIDVIAYPPGYDSSLK